MEPNTCTLRRGTKTNNRTSAPGLALGCLIRTVTPDQEEAEAQSLSDGADSLELIS